MKTELQQLKERYPDLHYDGGAFYPHPESDQFILDPECDEGEIVNLNADYIIREHYNSQKRSNHVDSDYIKSWFGSYDRAFFDA